MFYRALGGVGRSMMSAGVLILLFVAYQLWGTGLRTNQAQSSLQAEFDALKTQVAQSAPGTGGSPTANGSTLPPPATSSSTAPSATSSTAPGGPGATSVPSVPSVPSSSTAPIPAPPTIPAPRPGGPIGTIQIPAIGVDFVMVEGVDLSYLDDGPGHFPSTPFPGQAGNAALAGHRTTWQAPFNRIDEVVPGDLVHVETLQGKFTYKLRALTTGESGEALAHRIITPYQTEILDQHEGENTLTLMACHPKYSAAQRIIVVGDLVENPAPPTPKSVDTNVAPELIDETVWFGGSGGDLVGGDPAARTPAIAWSAIAAAVWLAAWLLARRWRSWREWQRWTVYGAALPLFFVPLFLAFENINHLLPAGY